MPMKLKKFQVGSKIVQVKAKDADTDNLGKIKFEISADTPAEVQKYFRINPETGAFFLYFFDHNKDV